MAHIVALPCRDCKYTECVVVCPAECFREGGRMLYIHPDVCIDCEACVPVCPANAIYHENELPEEWVPFRDLNATMARQCKAITEQRSIANN
jgi:ferredoxin